MNNKFRLRTSVIKQLFANIEHLGLLIIISSSLTQVRSFVTCNQRRRS